MVVRLFVNRLGASVIALVLIALIGLHAVTFGNGRFVVVGRQILSSTDGRTWSKAEYPGYIYTLRAVSYGAGIFVALGDQGKIITSTDGLSWGRPAAVHDGQ